MIKRILLICLVLLAIAGCKQTAVGHDAAFEEAISCIEEYKFDEAYEKMLVLANNGHARAQYHVGWMYHNGNGVKQNVQTALLWYRKSAESGHSLAMSVLAYSYANGTLGHVNCDKSLKWIRKALELDDKDAMIMFGDWYAKGLCVDKDLLLEKKYYTLYLNADGISDYKLGEMLFWGQGVDRNRAKGVRLMESDYKGNILSGGYVLGVAYSNGYGVSKDYEKAYRYFLSSAIAGNTASQYNVGVFLFNGKGVSADKDKAFYWVMKAAEKYDAKALTFIGYLYEVGEMLERDHAKAKEHYEKAILLGGKTAKKRLESIQ